MRKSETSSLHILLFATALFLLSLALSTASARNPSLAQSGMLVFEELFFPLRQGATNGFQSISRVWHGYIALREDAAKAKRLEREKRQWEARFRDLQTIAQENRELRSLLDMKQRQSLQGIVSSVIGFERSAWLRSINIDKGRRDGVEVGDAVVAHGAVLGQVMSTALRSSKVLLLVDAGSGIAARVENTTPLGEQEPRSGPRGVVAGRGKELCTLQYVAATETVSAGDRVVTSGLDGIFPRGIEIGRVEKAEKEESALFYSIFVRPSVRFDEVTDVLVLRAAFVDDVPAEAVSSPKKTLSHQASSSSTIQQGQGR